MNSDDMSDPEPERVESNNNNIIETILSLTDAPWYHLILEVCLFIWIVWLIRKKKKRDAAEIVLSKEEEDEIIRNWRPSPLVDSDDVDGSDQNYISTVWSSAEVENCPGKYVTVEGKNYLNLGTHNYLSFVDDESIIAEAQSCIRQYGVGSCGPRGFYGSFDVHTKLEEKISEFMGLEEAVLYSYGFSTIASAIPSYAKKGDIIYADQAVNFAIQKGLIASRSTIHYFRHNDYEHFQDLLEEQAARDAKNPKKAKIQRRFCVVEGIYQKTGTICQLKQINELCLKYKIRLFIDESISLGVLGKTGRGVTEHFDVPRHDVDFIAGTMEYTFGSYGGFIVGSSYVVDHQRLSGLGYCFSASLPPFLAGAGVQAIDLLMKNPSFVEQLQDNCLIMDSLLRDLPGLVLTGDPISPLKFLSLQVSSGSRLNDHIIIDRIIEYVKDQFGIAIIQPVLLENEERVLPPPSLRITINRSLTKIDMANVKIALESAVAALSFQLEDSETEYEPMEDDPEFQQRDEKEEEADEDDSN